jgi:DNA-binding response OmpR family regulator
MTLDSLLLSQDSNLVRVVKPTLEKLSIDVDLCSEARAAADILISEKFDAVIVDCDDLAGGLEVLQGVRSTPSNRNCVAFAILNGKKTTTQEAFTLGANFVLQKPISALNASRCFNAAVNFMIKERRRYFRQPLQMDVTLVLGDKKWKAVSTNISEGGMSLMVREALPKGETYLLTFSLPESKISLELEAEIAWADMSGRVGFRFQNVPTNSQLPLEKWLDDRMEKEFPGAKARIAAAALDSGQ